MIDVSTIQDIRTLYQRGKRVSEISRSLNISEPTVRKYLKLEDFNAPLPVSKERTSILDNFKEIIVNWLEEDSHNWHKQRHTAKRVYDRLCNEHGYRGSYSTVRRYVADLRGHSASESYLDLIWPPAEAQVDFGQADCILLGKKMRMHFLVLTFPYSNVPFAQMFYGENAECVCEGLMSIFNHLGGVPARLIFDNATGVGKKICEGIRLTELFKRFSLHFGFETTFCNPNSGHEKGNVENMVGALRRNLFVPIPEIDDLEAYNVVLMDRSYFQADKIHYRKGERCHALFGEDVVALRDLPKTDFSVVRFENFKTDKYGNVCVNRNHRYSTEPDYGKEEVIVGFRANKIDIYNKDGLLLATHRRLYGESPQESIDPGSSLRLLLRRPGAWRNSSLRFSLPEDLRNYIDSAPEVSMLKSYLSTLADITDETDLPTAIEAMNNTYRSTGRISKTDCMVYAYRLFDGVHITYDEPSDLESYDAVFLSEEVVF